MRNRDAILIRWHPPWPPPPNTKVLDPTAPPLLSARHPYERRLGVWGRHLLIEGFAGEEGDPQLPQNKGQDGQQRNNPENFTVMQRHDPSLSLAPNLGGEPGPASAPIAKARWKALGKAGLTTPLQRRIGARYRGAAFLGRYAASRLFRRAARGSRGLLDLPRPSRAAEACPSRPHLPVP